MVRRRPRGRRRPFDLAPRRYNSRMDDARLEAFHLIEAVQTEDAPDPEELERRL
ncbi:MAG: hypothetical protein QOD73_2108, partial [Solirubrobacteraceae bacterium]|nr:hypothetical protein [Solirubrobacteraceae bacterium]